MLYKWNLPRHFLTQHHHIFSIKLTSVIIISIVTAHLYTVLRTSDNSHIFVWECVSQVHRMEKESGLYYATLVQCAQWWTVYTHSWNTPCVSAAVSGVSVQSPRQIWNNIRWQILNVALWCSKTHLNGLQGRFHIQNKLNSVRCICDMLSITMQNNTFLSL